MNIEYIEMGKNTRKLSHTVQIRLCKSTKCKVTRQYVLFTGEKNIGFMALDFMPNQDKLVLYELFIDPNYRNQGIGSSAIGWAELTAKEHGYSKLFIKVSSLDPNISKEYLKNWYIKRGFKIVPDLLDNMEKAVN